MTCANRQRQLFFHPASCFCWMINPSSGIPVLHKDAAEPRMHMPPVSVDRVADCQCLQSTLVMGIPAYDCPRHFTPSYQRGVLVSQRRMLPSFCFLGEPGSFSIYDICPNRSSPASPPIFVSSMGFELGLLTIF